MSRWTDRYAVMPPAAASTCALHECAGVGLEGGHCFVHRAVGGGSLCARMLLTVIAACWVAAAAAAARWAALSTSP